MEIFLLAVIKKGEQRVEREKGMMRELGGWGRCVLARRVKRLIKSANSGLE